MDFYGDDYSSAYAWGELEHERREKMYHEYITEAMRFVSINTAGNEERQYLTCSLSDLISPKEDILSDSGETLEEIKEKQDKILKKLFGKRGAIKGNGRL